MPRRRAPSANEEYGLLLTSVYNLLGSRPTLSDERLIASLRRIALLKCVTPEEEKIALILLKQGMVRDLQKALGKELLRQRTLRLATKPIEPPKPLRRRKK